MFFNQYPYMNLNDFNLDYILKALKTLSEQLENFISLNTIKYANPIQWNITKQYEANTVVIDANDGTAYLSVKPVPTGVAITNTDYWTPIFTLNLLSANQNITLRDDGSNVLATFASSVDDWLIWNGTLYKVTRAIAVNEAYVVGYNLTRYSVELFLSDAVSAINTIIGDLNDLNTSDKTSVVNAINSTLTDIKSLMWFVTLEEYGAVGDGATDDTNAMVAALTAQKPIVLNANKSYVINTISVGDVELIGNGATLISKSAYLLSQYNSMKFKNVHFEFDNAGQGLINPSSNEGQEITLIDCEFTNAVAVSDPNESFLPYGACVFANAKYVNVIGCYASNVAGHFCRTLSTQAHSVVHFENNVINNSMVAPATITSSYGFGSYQSPANANNYDLVNISGNHIDGMLGSGIACHSMSNAFITNNEVSNCGEHAIVFMGGYHAEIANNKCIESVGCGVRVQSNNRAYDTSYVNVHDNIIKGNGVLLGGGRVDNVEVHNNFIEGISGAFYGVRFTGYYNGDTSGCNDVVVKDNVIKNVTYPLYVERGANKDFSAVDNLINNKNEYGASYGGFEWVRVNAMNENMHFYDNSVPATINGTVSGEIYTATGQRFLEAVATVSDLPMTTEYCGLSFDYDANCPCSCGIGFYISGGTLLGPLVSYPPEIVGDEATKSHYEFMFDVQSAFNQVKGAHTASEVLGVAIRIVKASGISTTTAEIKNVTMFKGNRGLLK